MRSDFPASRLCDVVGVSARGLRAFRSRPASRRQRSDLVTLAHIKEQSRLSLGSYGRPRMTEELKEIGLDVGHRRVGSSRRVIGWAVSNRMKRDLAIRALEMAIAFRTPPRGCIHHTDRGSQYCSHDYQKILRQHGFKVSMSGKGNCYDNAAVETFFKTIKAELIWRHPWETRRKAEMAIFEYINGFYNPRRRHSALGWKSPVAFERKVA